MKNIYRIFIFLIVANTHTHLFAESAFKYYRLENLKSFENVLYWDKKVYNDLLVQFKNRQGCLNITTLPLTHKEFEKNIYNPNVGNFEESFRKIPLVINGKESDAIVNPLGNNDCSIDLKEYYNGIAFMFHYFGTCDTKKYLEPVLHSFHFRNDIEKVKKARQGFKSMIEHIKVKKIPIFNPSYDTKFDFIQLSKRVYFYTKIEHNSLKIFSYYKQYLEKHNWKPYKEENKGNWHDNNLNYIWVDEFEELMLSLFIKQEPHADKANNSIQKVYINLSPFKDDLAGYCEINK